MSNLVSVQWLNEHIDDKNLIILDATMKKKPNGEVIPTPLYKIPKTHIFNFDTEICDQNTQLPHMLCTESEFESAVKKLNINNDSMIVIYDAMGVFSSPRAWWMFKVMGHKNVLVLNGGLPEWIKHGFNTQSDYSQGHDSKNSDLHCGNFITKFAKESVYSCQQVTESIKNSSIQLLDARSHGRFNGTEPEPRTELQSGHIPQSSCLPFTELLDNGLLKSKNELMIIFKSIVKPETQQLLFSCGSGVTASILALAADECGYKNTLLYDGSWSEWAILN